MDDKRVNATAGGVGIPTVVQIVFIILKLTGNITWSWLWVLSPMWIGLAAFMLVGIISIIIALVSIHKRNKK